ELVYVVGVSGHLFRGARQPARTSGSGGTTGSREAPRNGPTLGRPVILASRGRDSLTGERRSGARASAADRARSAALDCGVRRYFLQGLKLGKSTDWEKVW